VLDCKQEIQIESVSSGLCRQQLQHFKVVVFQSCGISNLWYFVVAFTLPKRHALLHQQWKLKANEFG
jgi:hypothetical protein